MVFSIADAKIGPIDLAAVLAGGTLELVLDPNYIPTLGDSFDILSTTSGVSGKFGAVTGAYLGGGHGFDVTYDPNAVTVKVIDVLLGDFDVDGDGFDFLTWQLDPSIGALSDWQANYGMTAPLSAATAVVPEPSGIILALGGLAFAARRRTR